MTRSAWIAVVALMLMSVAQLFANPPPPPKNPPPIVVTPAINVVVDDKATEAKLIIPKKVLATLKADAGDPGPGDTRKAEAVPQYHLIVAGCALAVALAVGGFWFVRGRRRSGAMVVLLAGAGVVAVASLAWANIAPPPPQPKPPFVVPAVVPGIPLADKVKVEVVEQGDTILLVVSREHLTKVLDKSPPPEKK